MSGTKHPSDYLPEPQASPAVAAAALGINDNEHRPCPFCGSQRIRKTEEWFSGDEGEFIVDIVECLDCRGQAPAGIWNERRAPDQAWQERLGNTTESAPGLNEL